MTVRKVGAAKVSLAGMLILLIIVANFLLPNGSKRYLSYVEVFAGIMEFSVIALVAINIIYASELCGMRRFGKIPLLQFHGLEISKKIVQY